LAPGQIWRSLDGSRDVQILLVFRLPNRVTSVSVVTIRAPIGVGRRYTWQATVFGPNGRYRLLAESPSDATIPA
jgi:hypothetical protein